MLINTNRDLDRSKLSQENRESIQNSLYGGGRSLNAIWALDIAVPQKMVLLYLGHKMDFKKGFVNSFVSVSSSEITLQTGYSKPTVDEALSGLINFGYIKKSTPNIALCITEHVSCSYCLTQKSFDEFLFKSIEWKKISSADTKQRKGYYSFLHQKYKQATRNKKGPRQAALLAQEPSKASLLDGGSRQVALLGLGKQVYQGWVSSLPRARQTGINIFLINPNSSLLYVCGENTHTEKKFKNLNSSEDILKNESVIVNSEDPNTVIINTVVKEEEVIKCEQILSENTYLKNSVINLPVERLDVSGVNFLLLNKNLSNQGQNNALKSIRREREISEIAKKLKDTACLVFQKKVFIPFGDCEKAIVAAMQQTSASLNDITIAVEEKAKYGVFSGQSISAMTNDLVEWIHCKDKIIEKFEKQNKTHKENTDEIIVQKSIDLSLCMDKNGYYIPKKKA